MRSSTVLKVTGVAIIALVIGLAFGAAAFPMTKTITQFATITKSGTTTTSTIVVTPNFYFFSSDSTSLVTMTQLVLIEGVVIYSVTVSGSCTLGQGTTNAARMTTTTTFIIPTNFTSSEFSATITTVTSTTISMQVVTMTITNTTTTSGCPTIV